MYNNTFVNTRIAFWTLSAPLPTCPKYSIKWKQYRRVTNQKYFRLPSALKDDTIGKIFSSKFHSPFFSSRHILCQVWELKNSRRRLIDFGKATIVNFIYKANKGRGRQMFEIMTIISRVIWRITSVI